MFDLIHKNTADEFGKIQLILRTEVRDFREGMKGQVGTIFCSATTKLVWMFTSNHKKLGLQITGMKENQAMPGYRI